MTNISVKILKDSICEGSRLTTWLWRYPRAIHSEVLTHGSLRRNSASSRAIPAAKLRERTLQDPFIPVHWGLNQKGMQADAELSSEDQYRAELLWRDALDSAAYYHEEAEKLGLHKQIVNRLIEPWMMIEVIISGTDWANFFHQRTHTAAEPNFQVLARAAWEEYSSNLPEVLERGEWHLPLIYAEDRSEHSLDDLKKIATGRCARVSYLTHLGVRDPKEDVALHDRLAGTFGSSEPGHFSPFEHSAEAVGGGRRIGPFEGWKQYRKFFPNEAGPTTVKCQRCGLWNGQHVEKCPRPTKFDLSDCDCTECRFLKEVKESK